MALVSCRQAEAPGGLVTSLGVPRLSPRWREGPHTTGGRRETRGWVQELLGRCLQVSSTMGHPHSHPHLLEPRWKVLLIHPWDSACVLWWLQKHLGNLSFLQPNPPGCLCPTRGGASPQPPGWGGTSAQPHCPQEPQQSQVGLIIPYTGLLLPSPHSSRKGTALPWEENKGFLLHARPWSHQEMRWLGKLVG